MLELATGATRNWTELNLVGDVAEIPAGVRGLILIPIFSAWRTATSIGLATTTTIMLGCVSAFSRVDYPLGF
jgi:hypothetical protein